MAPMPPMPPMPPQAAEAALAPAAARRRPGRLMPRMYQQIYLAVLAALALTVLITIVAFQFVDRNRSETVAYQTFVELIVDSLPKDAGSAQAQREAIARWAARTASRIALYDARRALLASAGDEVLAPPPPDQAESGWAGIGRSRYCARLADGRWLVLKAGGESEGRRKWGGIGLLVLIAVFVGAAVYPIVRRIASRLERLQAGVEALGEGNFQSRVDFAGGDEVGRLAESFNRAAARVGALMAAQKTLLANASHELRSPLARIQMALDLVGTSEDAGARREINTSIRELDALIGEILLSSRFESENFQAVIGDRPIDLTGLAAEEAARVEAAVAGEPLLVMGDAVLLRRLLRNLLENARRHGGGAAIEVLVERAGAMARITVSDSGPGIAPAERERIFEPFYRVRGGRESDGGVGLGLALVRSIAGQHAGRVYYEEGPAGGSRFCVLLPLRGPARPV